MKKHRTKSRKKPKGGSSSSSLEQIASKEEKEDHNQSDSRNNEADHSLAPRSLITIAANNGLLPPLEPKAPPLKFGEKNTARKQSAFHEPLLDEPKISVAKSIPRSFPKNITGRSPSLFAPRSVTGAYSASRRMYVQSGSYSPVRNRTKSTDPNNHRDDYMANNEVNMILSEHLVQQEQLTMKSQPSFGSVSHGLQGGQLPANNRLSHP